MIVCVSVHFASIVCLFVCSDYSIAQFRFLEQLLLVHGRWNYQRVCLVILWSFYKNIVSVLILLMFNTQTGWTGVCSL